MNFTSKILAEFDEKFPICSCHGLVGGNCDTRGCSQTPTRLEIKSFIIEALEANKKQIIEEAQKELREYKDKFPNAEFHEAISYLAAMSARPNP